VWLEAFQDLDAVREVKMGTFVATERDYVMRFEND
jgi:hypothetical protein